MWHNQVQLFPWRRDMNIAVNPQQTITFGECREISMYIRGFFLANIGQFCVLEPRCSTECSTEMTYHQLTKSECEPLWFVIQPLGTTDLVWEVDHHVSEQFSDGAVRIACLSRNCTCTTSPKLWCLWLYGTRIFIIFHNMDYWKYIREFVLIKMKTAIKSWT